MQLLKKISIAVLTYHIPFLFNAKFKIQEFDLVLNLTFLLIAKGNIYSNVQPAKLSFNAMVQQRN